MKQREAKACIMRVCGTNCDKETVEAFKELNVHAEVVHMNEFLRQRSLLEFNILVIPGGFSYGDYVRAGAIWAKRILSKLSREIKQFIGEERPILGICNGFQVLVEAGLLPSFNGLSVYPQAALATNTPPGYNCRWINVKHENAGNCIFTRKIPKKKVLNMPVAHAEGRFIFPKGEEARLFEKLLESDQLVLRYCFEDGKDACGEYPINPNGAYKDVAGICDPSGTIFGLMPHPERAFFWWQLPDWTKKKLFKNGDGRLIFESAVDYLTRRF